MAPRLKHSLYGRIFGISFEDCAYAENGFQANVTEATSASTSDVIPADGMTTLNSSAGDAYTMAAPVPGVLKELFVTSTGTNNISVGLASGNFQTTAGSSFTHVIFDGQGDNVVLRGISTAIYAVLSQTVEAFTTSTST